MILLYETNQHKIENGETLMYFCLIIDVTFMITRSPCGVVVNVLIG